MSSRIHVIPKIGRVFPMLSVVGVLSACGITGLDPTGTAAMIQFEAHRRQSMELQRRATSVEAADQREDDMRRAIQFCREHPEVEGCPDAVRNEASTMEAMRKVRSIQQH